MNNQKVLCNLASNEPKSNRWSAIANFPQQAAGYDTLDNSSGKLDCEENAPSASKHRRAVLKAATKFARSYKGLISKRQRELIDLTPNKRMKATKATNAIAPKTLGCVTTHSTASSHRLAQASVSSRELGNASVKHYLQTTKQSTLNLLPNLAHGSKQTAYLGMENRVGGYTQDERTDSCSVRDSSSCTLRMAPEDPGISNEEQNPTPATDTRHSFQIEAGDEFMDEELDDYFSTSGNAITGNELFSMQKHGQFLRNSTPSTLLGSSPALQTVPSSFPVPPFLRQSYFEPISTIKYSPVPRLTSSLRTITCFRIAEVLRLRRTGSAGGESQENITIELYAMAILKESTKGKRTFRFADLFFPNRPPYIEGSGQGVGSLLISNDRQEHRGEVMCRAIVRWTPLHQGSSSSNCNPAASKSAMLHQSATTIPRVHVEAIRESNWVEVEYVRGIVDPSPVEAEKPESQREKSKLVIGVE